MQQFYWVYYAFVGKYAFIGFNGLLLGNMLLLGLMLLLGNIVFIREDSLILGVGFYDFIGRRTRLRNSQRL